MITTPQAPHTTEAQKLHTPLPWRVDIHTLTISAADGNVGLLNLARKEDESRANAVLIVDRVNSFDALTEANARMLVFVESVANNPRLCATPGSTKRRAQDLLAAIKAQS